MQLLSGFLMRKCWLEATTVYYSITPPLLVKPQFSTVMMEHFGHGRNDDGDDLLPPLDIALS